MQMHCCVAAIWYAAAQLSTFIEEGDTSMADSGAIGCALSVHSG